MIKKSKYRSHEVIKYSKITPQIYIGTNLCCGVHSVQLRKLGVRVDIDLEYTHAENFSSPDMEAILILPVRDHSTPPQRQFEMGVAFLEVAVKTKKKTYVHCLNGHGRSPTLVIAYFMKTNGWSLNESFEYIKKRRPPIHITKSQIAGLRKYKKSLKRR
ncbi:MAG: dual specificity protein phosphatase [bacterium]|nr:dual specificity protein phosphatase [bacterium]